MTLQDAKQVADYYGWRGRRRDCFIAACLRAGGMTLAEIGLVTGCDGRTAARRVRNAHEAWGNAIFDKNAARQKVAGHAVPAIAETRLHADGLIYVGIRPIGSDEASDIIGTYCRQKKREAEQ